MDQTKIITYGQVNATTLRINTVKLDYKKLARQATHTFAYL